MVQGAQTAARAFGIVLLAVLALALTVWGPAELVLQARLSGGLVGGLVLLGVLDFVAGREEAGGRQSRRAVVVEEDDP